MITENNKEEQRMPMWSVELHQKAMIRIIEIPEEDRKEVYFKK